MKNLKQIERSIQTLRLSLVQSSMDLDAALVLVTNDFPYCRASLKSCRSSLDCTKKACEIALDELSCDR